jgi:hypothetical protein
MPEVVREYHVREVQTGEQSINQSRANDSQASFHITMQTKAKQEQGGQKK